MYADEEPIEHILYGQGDYDPAPINLYLSDMETVERFREACDRGDWDEAMQAGTRLSRRGWRLSQEQLRIILDAVDKIFPICPYPVLSFDPAPGLPFMDRIWNMTTRLGDFELDYRAGFLLVRVCECLGCFREARTVLGMLRDRARKAGDRAKEASTLNNLGFTHLYEGGYQEALPLFVEAAGVYRELGANLNHANALANYWHCRFELGLWGDGTEARDAIQQISKTLETAGEWYARKPFILRARLAERDGNFREAASFVIKAIRSAKNSASRYPEIDHAYLRKLRAAQRRKILLAR